MNDKLLNRLAKRKPDTLSTKIIDNQSKHLGEIQSSIICSSTDFGVLLNGGRRGARFAPEAILSVLRKMIAPQNCSQFNLYETANFADEEIDFHQAQINQADRISKLVEKSSTILHLGGGHDHVYPLLKDLSESLDKIRIINIDAHLDTRNEEDFHSGTPFRQLASSFKNGIEIHQLGIHPYANAHSNYTELTNSNMSVYGVMDIKNQTRNYTDYNDLFNDIMPNDDTFTVISLDADGLSSNDMEAVSAVNHFGLPTDFVRAVISHYVTLKQDRKIFGIYEYNPVFDNLSQKGARVLADLIYHYMF